MVYTSVYVMHTCNIYMSAEGKCWDTYGDVGETLCFDGGLVVPSVPDGLCYRN